MTSISTAFDQGEFAIGLFLDLSKAFDTVDHAIFLTNSNIMEYVV